VPTPADGRSYARLSLTLAALIFISICMSPMNDTASLFKPGDRTKRGVGLPPHSRGEAAAVADRLGLGTPGKPIQAIKH
jgi:hypothetical protein